MNCPKCNEPCDRIEVDIGVGVQCGPWGCCFCGWSQYEEYDRSDGPSPAQKEEGPGRYVDPLGVSHSVKRIIEGCDRFGLGEAAKDAFKDVNGPEGESQ